jgi:hypothetical protein
MIRIMMMIMIKVLVMMMMMMRRRRMRRRRRRKNTTDWGYKKRERRCGKARKKIRKNIFLLVMKSALLKTRRSQN